MAYDLTRPAVPVQLAVPEASYAVPGSTAGATSWMASRPRPFLLFMVALVAFPIGALSVFRLHFGLALLIALGVVIAVLVRPLIGGLTLVGLVPVLSGLAPGIPVPYVRISEALVGLVGVTLMLSVRREDSVPWKTLDWLLLAYGLAWAFFGAFDSVSLHETLTLSDWGTILGQLQFFLIYRGVRLALRSEAERKTALWVLIGASAPVAVLAIFQQIKVPGVPQFLNTITGGLAEPAIATGTSLHRATGPFVNWAALAGYLLPLLLVLCALALGGQIDRRKRAVLLLASLAMIGLALTAELSAIVCLLIGIVVLGAMYGKARSTFRWLAIGLLGAAILVGPFIGARLSNELSSSAGDARTAGVPQTLDFRWQVWSGQYIPAIEAEPVTGYGVVLPTSIRWVYSESQYVSLLMEGGIPLLLLFGLLSWSMIDKGRALSRSSEPFDQALGRALVVAVAATLVMDLIWPYLSNGGLPQVLWCLYAIAEPRRNRPPLDTSGSLTHASSDLGAQSRDRAPLLVGAQ